MMEFLTQLKWELRKLFARKRTYLGFIAFAVAEIGILLLAHHPRIVRAMRKTIEQAGYLPDEFLSGLTFALILLKYTILLLGGLYLALVAGDVVGKEVEDGTMRMILSRPVSRRRILALKAAASFGYTFALVVFISVTALLAGFVQGGMGGLFVYSPHEGIFSLFEFREGLLRYFQALPLLVLSLTPITFLAFFFSCLNIKPAAATIATLSVFFFDMILTIIPYFDSLKEYFFTTRMSAWIYMFQYQIPVERMLEDYLWLGGVNATLLVLAWAAFESRDFKS